jgi:hypothetical protein
MLMPLPLALREQRARSAAAPHAARRSAQRSSSEGKPLSRLDKKATTPNEKRRFSLGNTPFLP